MVIASNFSVVSLPFCLLVTDVLNLSEHFLVYYATVVAAGLFAAMVVPRLPPLSKVADDFVEGRSREPPPRRPPDLGVVRWAVRQAARRAQTAPGARDLVLNASHNLLDIWFGLIPAVVFVGWIGLALVEHTPIVDWAALPLVYLLEVLRLPEASSAAPALLVGFADMFLPAVVGRGIESELTRFVVAVISVTQLIYMSEVGVLLLKSSLPFRFTHLVALFLLRTLVTLPIAAVAAHLMF